jgi:pimeloyl-ACP methyl ester carboxylesterase
MFASASVLCLYSGSANSANKTSLGQTMTLKDEGVFYVNGQVIKSDFPSAPAVGNPAPASFTVNQMFVHYRIPASNKHKVPIIMVHGSGLTGVTYETTPDGREGWATYFTRQGFDTYIVDFPGRGRAGFNVTPLNQAKVQNNVALQPSMSRGGMEAAWVNHRVGPVYLTPFPGVKNASVSDNGTINMETFATFSAQGFPNAEATLTPDADTTIPAALAALLQKIGPAILMVHSQGGQFGDTTVGLRPDLIKMMIHVESNCRNGAPFTPAQIDGYKKVPSVLYVHGDNVVGNPASTGQPRLDACTSAMNSINAAGGHATLVQLPDVGIKGNDHMMMQDRNNLEVADWIIKQIEKRGL